MLFLEIQNKTNNYRNLNKQTTSKHTKIYTRISYWLSKRWSCFMVQEQFYYRLIIATLSFVQRSELKLKTTTTVGHMDDF